MAEEKKETAVEEVKAEPVKEEAKTEEKPAEKKAPAKKTAARKPRAKKAPAKKEPEVKEFKYRDPVQKDFEILKGPYVTEKTQILSQKENKVVLRVSKDATAPEIKSAVQAVFKVKVDKVNIINVLPRKKRSYRYPGQVSGFKKAIVKINKDYDLGKIAEAASAEASK